MKSSALLLAAWMVLGAACASRRPAVTPVTGVNAGSIPELTNRDFIFAVFRYLYRWHSDTATWLPTTEAEQIEIRVRLIHVETDANDRSRFAELWLPGAGLMVDLKQADHEVPERKLVLKDDGFKVRSVHRIDAHPAPPANWTVLRLPSKEVIAHLFQTRQERLFPDGAFVNRLRDTLADYLRRHHEQELMAGAQTYYAAPMSPVSNELWLYWENQRTALRFAADGDLANPRIWEQAAMHLRLVNLDGNVTQSPEEALWAGRPVSREWAGRLLYNCVVLGRKFTLSASPDTR
jgi:hypothetical protein